jgi:hypothetical protein
VNRDGYVPHFRANVYVGLPPFGFHALRVNAHRFLWSGKFVAPKAFGRRLSGSAPIETVNTEKQKLGCSLKVEVKTGRRSERDRPHLCALPCSCEI